jgi:F-type H+-transporting ATPase subunit b
MSDFFANAQNWVLLSFIIFVFLAYKLGRSSVLNAIDSHIDKARTDVEDAEKLRVEAQELLSDYQRLKSEATTEAENIVKVAAQHAEKIKDNAVKSLDTELARREEQLKERLSNMEAQAFEEMRHYAADLAVKATREIIIENIDSKKAKSLNDKAIAEVTKDFAA